MGGKYANGREICQWEGNMPMGGKHANGRVCIPLAIINYLRCVLYISHLNYVLSKFSRNLVLDDIY